MWIWWTAHRAIETLLLLMFGAILMVPLGMVYDIVWFAPIRAEIDIALAQASPSERTPSGSVKQTFRVTGAEFGSIYGRAAWAAFDLRLDRQTLREYPDIPTKFGVALVWPLVLRAHYNENQMATLALYREGWTRSWDHGPGALSIAALGKDLNELSVRELSCLAHFLRVRATREECGDLEHRMAAITAKAVGQQRR